MCHVSNGVVPKNSPTIIIFLLRLRIFTTNLKYLAKALFLFCILSLMIKEFYLLGISFSFELHYENKLQLILSGQINI
jgi:hypothetical protein